MGKFDSEKGLCHLVFANEDTYYLKSLIKLNLRQYLYYELKKKGYRAVYYLSGYEGGFSLTISDNVSQAVYERYRDQTAIQKLKIFLKGKESDGSYTGKRLPVSDYVQLMEELLWMMKSEERLAFVFNIETFHALSCYPKLIDSFCQAAQNNYNRGHIFLIQAPVVVKGSFSYLTDMKGIFRSQLFPEVCRIFSSPKNIQLYERLKDELGQRVIFLNVLERSSIYYMVQHFLMEQGSAMVQYFVRTDDYTDFIWGCYHSSDFCEQVGSFFPENEKRLMSVIRDSLSDRSIFMEMDEQICKIRERVDGTISLMQWIVDTYSADSWLRLIYEDSVPLSRLEKLPSSKLGSDCNKQLKHIREELKKPSMFLQDVEGIEYINRCVKHLHTACQRDDCLTMNKAVEGLYYAVCGRLTIESYEMDGQDARLHLHLKMMEVAEKLYDIAKQHKEECRKIEEYRKQMEKCIQEVHAYEETHDHLSEESEELEKEGLRSGNSPALQTLAVKKSEAVSLKKDIYSREKLQTQKERLMIQCIENIQKMEMAISNMATGNMNNLKENMEYTTRLVRNISAENNQLFNELEEAMKNFY